MQARVGCIGLDVRAVAAGERGAGGVDAGDIAIVTTAVLYDFITGGVHVSEVIVVAGRGAVVTRAGWQTHSVTPSASAAALASFTFSVIGLSFLLADLVRGTVEAGHQVWQAAYLAHGGGGVECSSGQVDAYRWAVGWVRWVGGEHARPP